MPKFLHRASGLVRSDSMKPNRTERRVFLAALLGLTASTRRARRGRPAPIAGTGYQAIGTGTAIAGCGCTDGGGTEPRACASPSRALRTARPQRLRKAPAHHLGRQARRLHHAEAGAPRFIAALSG